MKDFRQPDLTQSGKAEHNLAIKTADYRKKDALMQQSIKVVALFHAKQAEIDAFKKGKDLTNLSTADTALYNRLEAELVALDDKIYELEAQIDKILDKYEPLEEDNHVEYNDNHEEEYTSTLPAATRKTSGKAFSGRPLFGKILCILLTLFFIWTLKNNYSTADALFTQGIWIIGVFFILSLAGLAGRGKTLFITNSIGIIGFIYLSVFNYLPINTFAAPIRALQQTLIENDTTFEYAERFLQNNLTHNPALAYYLLQAEQANKQ